MDEDNRPKWRDDPEETFSDWTIKIISGDEEIECNEIYHVHKNFLAHGPRRSEYFSRLFRSEVSFNENESSMSQIKLDPLAANAFPSLLDYVYGADLNICTETATAQHHLANYFEMSSLRLESLEFFHQDMSIETMHVYYVHARQLNDEVVMERVTDFLRSKINQVLPTHPIVDQSDPQLWINAIGLDKNPSERVIVDDTRQLSLVLAEMFMSQSEETMDAETFLILADSLSSIDPNAALDLCELADHYCACVKEEELDNDEELGPLFLLQERCASALSKNWKDLKSLDGTKVDRMLKRRPDFLVSLLMHSSREASQEVDALEIELAFGQRLLTPPKK